MRVKSKIKEFIRKNCFKTERGKRNFRKIDVKKIFWL